MGSAILSTLNEYPLAEPTIRMDHYTFAARIPPEHARVHDREPGTLSGVSTQYSVLKHTLEEYSYTAMKTVLIVSKLTLLLMV